MLFDLIFSILNLFVSGLFAFLPDMNLPNELIYDINAVAYYMGFLNVFVSLNLCAMIVSLTIVRDNISYIKDILISLWKLLPFT